ncbi:MerR family transcriptional regulator [Paraburkholderia phosphatilytica]|uniref:MerR family transcriptional regulator n=1 Tax=Paraburkholderia phosphatilytica TaxID=2282883 RepID=UPI000E526266|nr:MerR family transcriptional regulator [Paraburkholderia phosphatilytica]
MDVRPPGLNASRAAGRLGVSTKALRLYEQHGLVTPSRTSSGYRIYSPEQMRRAERIVTLRALGLSLAQVAGVLDGDSRSLADALAAHEATLEDELRQQARRIDKVRALRAELASGRMPDEVALTDALARTALPAVSFALPWPWGGEPFELADIRPLNYLIGPLGSGKTRLARRIAEAIPGAVFLGLDRLQNHDAAAVMPALHPKVERALAWLIGEGATHSDALVTLLAGLETEGATAIVVDMVEQGLDHPTQEALGSYLRQRAATSAPPLFLMTRSSALLDLTLVGAYEAIVLCPANHSPPVRVAPYPGAPGYEAVLTCLASPEVRARTAGMIAWRPESPADALQRS